MSPSRRSAASEDSILASLERGPSSTRTHRGWLIIGGSAAAVLTLMIAWLAYGNATSVRALPPSAVKRPAAPPADNGMLNQTLPSISIPAPQSAAIVDEPAAEAPARPALVMLPREAIPALGERTPVSALPQEERVSRPSPAVKTIPVKPSAAPRQVAKTTKAAATKVGTRKAKAPAPSPVATPEVDSDVALLSAILAHSTRHAAERAQQESCQGKKCAVKPSTQP